MPVRRGRHAAPPAEQVAKGTQPCRIKNKNGGLTLRPVADAPPKSLGTEGKKAWRRICKLQNEMVSLGYLPWITTADAHILEAYCAAYETWQASYAELARLRSRKGRRGASWLLDKTETSSREHPIIRAEARQRKLLKDFAVQMGLTPATRMHIAAVAAGASKDTADALLN